MQDEYTGSSAGERLRASIEGRGKSLAAFARHSNIPYRSLQDYVAGKSKPGFEQLAKLAHQGLDVGYILTGHPTAETDELLPAMARLSDFALVGSHPYRRDETLGIADRVDRGVELRDWIDIWNMADAEVRPVDEGDLAKKRRQAAVALIACGIAIQVVERFKSLGWLSG